MPEVILYDGTGTIIPRVGEVEAPPIDEPIPRGVYTTTGDRWREHVSRGLTPSRLAQILDDADMGNPFDFFQLCEEILEKDLKFQSLFQTRTLAIQGLTRQILPAELNEDAPDSDKKLASDIAKFCEFALEDVNLDELIGDLMDAVAKPFSVDWIHWGLDVNGKAVPKQFQHIPGTHLTWSVRTNELRIYDPYDPKNYFTTRDVGDALPSFTTVRAISNTRKDNAARAGLMRTLCWYYLFKLTAYKDFATWLDRYGVPLRAVKVPPQQFADNAMYDKIRAALRALGTDGAGVFTADTELELLQAGSQGPDGFTAMIDLVNKEASQVVLGHELSSQSAPGQGQLGITAAIEVRQDYVEGDCNWLGAIIRRDILRPMTEWNFGGDVVLRGMVPYMWFDYEPSRDLIAESQVRLNVSKIYPSLLSSEQEVRDTFGIARPLNEPEPESDVIEFGQSGGGPQAELPPNAITPDPGPQQPMVQRVLYKRKRRRVR